MPLCRDHAELRGMIHFKARKPLGGLETVDYCPEHASRSDSRQLVMTESETERLRQVVRARDSGLAKRPHGPVSQGDLLGLTQVVTNTLQNALAVE
ncbi:hypothetical protein DFQ28_011411 [Apophysomyces sp. BC1034]|nr:hypothetical protein DFQ28_011411 [Apophysomyces sp. BC1034]